MKHISAEHYPTLSYTIPYYNILLDKLEEFCDSDEYTDENKVIFLFLFNLYQIFYLFLFLFYRK